MSTSIDRGIDIQYAIQKWVDPETGGPFLTRSSLETLEPRTVAAAELYLSGFYDTIQEAADQWKVPYYRLRYRIKGRNPVTQNGGNRTLLKTEEENAILCWAHRRVMQGHHIQLRALRHHANVILKATGREDASASQKWARSFMRRHKDKFTSKKSNTQEARRKAMQDRCYIEAWFEGWKKTLRELHVKPENVWNFDETGFMVGYLQKGTFVWTFREVEYVILTDAHDTVLVTAVEAVSATGAVIDPFLILPGVVVPVRWVTNNLPRQTTLATTPTGYINDIVAHEWIRHFDELTRPSDPAEKRILLMDGCESHFTREIFFYCDQHNIELFPFPPHLTHLLQPCDVGIFSLYKW